MVLNDPLANVLSAILNAETRGKRDCLLKPVSKVIKKVLEIMQDNKGKPVGQPTSLKKYRGRKAMKAFFEDHEVDADYIREKIV